MDYLDFIELVDYFKEGINEGIYEILSDSSEERFRILVMSINSRTILELDEMGYFTSVFGKDYRIELMISKKKW